PTGARARWDAPAQARPHTHDTSQPHTCPTTPTRPQPSAPATCTPAGHKSSRRPRTSGTPTPPPPASHASSPPCSPAKYRPSPRSPLAPLRLAGGRDARSDHHGDTTQRVRRDQHRQTPRRLTIGRIRLRQVNKHRVPAQRGRLDRPDHSAPVAEPIAKDHHAVVAGYPNLTRPTHPPTSNNRTTQIPQTTLTRPRPQPLLHLPQPKPHRTRT